MLRLLSLALISLALIYTNQGAVTEKFVTGKVTFPGPKELEKNSKVQVELRDTSLMDVASKLIASVTITDAKSFPIPYKVKYNPSVVVAGHTYTMSARITGPDGSLKYINDVHTPATLTGSSGPVVDIAVIRVGGDSSTSKVPTKEGGKKTCPVVNCRGKEKTCPYGLQKKDGCDICRCNDPCNPPGKPILCGSKQRCFIDKKPDGTFSTRCGPPESPSGHHGGKLTKAACKEPKEVGMCMAAFDRFYFNPTTKSCEKFIYGGCGGNKNNFSTKSACERLCKA